MSYFDKPVLLQFYGIPGSGKSFFARQIAAHMQAVRLNGDSMRIAMFGSPEGIEKAYTEENRDQLNAMVFGAIDYAVEQVLAAGQDVVYDAHHNKRLIRQKNGEVAMRYGVVPVIIWIKTPFEVALQRGQDRTEQLDQRRKTEEDMRRVIERHQASMDDPDETEHVIVIDGLLPFTRQRDAFEAGVRQIFDKEAQGAEV